MDTDLVGTEQMVLIRITEIVRQGMSEMDGEKKKAIECLCGWSPKLKVLQGQACNRNVRVR